MPDIRPVPVLQDTDFERTKYLFDQEPDDTMAVSLVHKTFKSYEARRMSIERKWSENAAMYHGVVEKRNWKGTDVERASLPVSITFNQVESAYPMICDALFNYWPTFFDVVELPGTTSAEAAQVLNVFASWLETPYDESGLTAVSNMKMAVHQAEKLGDGCIEMSWDMGQKRPIVEWVDTRDVYLSPRTPGPVIAWSPATIVRSLMNVQDLAELRGTSGIKIPSDAQLNFLAKSRYISSAEVTKQREALARAEAYYPADMEIDPQHQQIEVLRYWTKDRMIWILGRQWCAINKENPYGFVPIYRAPYTILEGRPNSISLIEPLIGSQKYAQGIRNARLDNLALALHRPRARAAGTPTNPAKMAWAPGMIDEVSDPKQVEVYPIDNITPDAMQEEMLIHQDADRTSGVNQGVQSGIPTPSNANRTAGGVNAQQGAVGNRLSVPVENFETFMIVPMLYGLQKMVKKFAPDVLEVQKPAVRDPKTGQMIPPQTIQAPKETFSKDVVFRIEASSRMKTKANLAAFLVPVTQLLFNPQIGQLAQTQGKTIDFGEWSRFMQDATGTARCYEFFRDLEPQEQQQMPPTPGAAAMQKAQLAAQSRDKATQAKSQTEQAKIQAMMQKAQMEQQSNQNQTGENSAAQVLQMLIKERMARFDSRMGADVLNNSPVGEK
jgi:hypothetical protein